jgi:UDP-N-acetylglucosamine 3-dehydrogenase
VLKKRLSVAILGAGQVGRVHARAFGRLKQQVEIVGVADLNLERAQELANEASTDAFADYRALLEHGPDVTVVCLPHALHHEACMLAASAGSHLLVEKPFTTSVAQAEEVVGACERAGVHLGVGYVHRYRQEFQRAREIVSSGLLGEIVAANDRYGLSGEGSVPEWVWKSGGGTLLYSGVHSLDWLRWLVGSEVVVACAFANERDEPSGTAGEPGGGGNPSSRDSFAATLKFANGCVATFSANQPAYQVSPRTRDTEFYGTRGRLRLRLGEGFDLSTDRGAYEVHVTRDDPFYAQASSFAAAVASQQQPAVTGVDGVRALKVVEALRVSAATNASVALTA